MVSERKIALKWFACVAVGSLIISVSAADLEVLSQDYNRGIELMEAGDLGAAREKLLSAFESGARDGGTDAKKIAAAAAHNLGSLYLREGILPDASAYLQQALELNPNHALARNNLGVVALKQGQLEKAREQFEAAIRLDPAETRPLNNLAELARSSGSHKEAAKLLLTSLRLNPANTESLMILLNVYVDQGLDRKIPPVVRALVGLSGGEEKKIKLAQKLSALGLSAEALSVLGRIPNPGGGSEETAAGLAKIRAEVLAKQGDFESAAAELNKLLSEGSEDPGVYGALAAVRVKQGLYSEARQLAQRASRVGPVSAETWFVSGVAAEALGETGAAQLAYRRAIEADSSHGRAYNNLGIILAKNNREDEAINHFYLALRSNPSEPDFRYNLGRALVTSRRDYPSGVRLLAAAGAAATPSGLRARQYLEALLRIGLAAEGDPNSPGAASPVEGLEGIRSRIQSELVLAILGGDVSRALELAKTAADFDTSLEGGITPLSVAAARGQTSVVGALLERGADVNSRNRQGRTPLIFATLNGHEGVVRSLLRADASIESQESDAGLTPLMGAILGGNLKVVSALLKAGAEVNTRAEDGQTALIKAAIAQWPEAVELLLDHRADPEVRDRSGRRAVDYASQGRVGQLLASVR